MRNHHHEATDRVGGHQGEEGMQMFHRFFQGRSNEEHSHRSNTGVYRGGDRIHPQTRLLITPFLKFVGPERTSEAARKQSH